MWVLLGLADADWLTDVVAVAEALALALCDGVVDRVSKVVGVGDWETVLEIEMEAVAVWDELWEVDGVAVAVPVMEGDALPVMEVVWEALAVPVALSVRDGVVVCDRDGVGEMEIVWETV